MRFKNENDENIILAKRVTDIFDGNIPLYFYYTDDKGEEITTSKQDIASDLQETLATWYVGIRNIVLVGMMIVLLYIGIRMMLSTIASDKAKYNQLLQDWFVGLLLVFFIHYIMAFSVTLVQKLTDVVSSSVDKNAYAVKFPVDENGKMVKWFNENKMTYMVYDENGNCLGNEDGTQEVKESEAAYIIYPTNILGKLRLDMQMCSWGPNYIGYAIAYVVLVMFTLYFIFTYLRRVLYMAFLTMIAPMVALTYPIDKINDGTIKIGDYVKYKPDTASTTEILQELNTYSGSNANTTSTLTQESLNWRVLDVKDGQVKKEEQF